MDSDLTSNGAIAENGAFTEPAPPSIDAPSSDVNFRASPSQRLPLDAAPDVYLDAAFSSMPYVDETPELYAENPSNDFMVRFLQPNAVSTAIEAVTSESHSKADDRGNNFKAPTLLSSLYQDPDINSYDGANDGKVRHTGEARKIKSPRRDNQNNSPDSIEQHGNKNNRNENNKNNNNKVSMNNTGNKFQANKIEDIPAFGSINVQRKKQSRRGTPSFTANRNAVTPMENQRASQQQHQSTAQEQQHPEETLLGEKADDAAGAKARHDANTPRPNASQEENAPVLDLNGHGKRLGISLFLCHVIIIAKMSGAIYVSSTLDASKLSWTWMPTAVFALNGISLVLELFVVVQGVLLICLKLQDSGPVASMLWHRLLAGCLSFVTEVLLSIIFLLIIIATVFEVLIYVELKNISLLKS